MPSQQGDMAMKHSFPLSSTALAIVLASTLAVASVASVGCTSSTPIGPNGGGAGGSEGGSGGSEGGSGGSGGSEGGSGGSEGGSGGSEGGSGGSGGSEGGAGGSEGGSGGSEGGAGGSGGSMGGAEGTMGGAGGAFETSIVLDLNREPSCGSYDSVQAVEDELLRPKCAEASCHSKGEGHDEPEFYPDLEIENMGAALVDAPIRFNDQCMGGDLYIDSADPDKSFLLVKSASGETPRCVDGTDGGVAMPQLEDLLPTADLECIRWYVHEVAKAAAED